MKCHLMSIGYKLWRSVRKEHKVPNDLSIDRYELDQYEANAKALNAILSGLNNSVFVKVMQCKTTKHAWKKSKLSMKEYPNSNNPNFRHTNDSLKF